MFKAPPLDQVAAGTPAALPKPFNVVPPDKNKSPSLKTVDVGGGKENSSVFVTAGGVSPAVASATVDVPAPLTPLLPVDILFTSVHEEPSQDSVLVVGGSFPAKTKADV